MELSIIPMDLLRILHAVALFGDPEAWTLLDFEFGPYKLPFSGGDPLVLKVGNVQRYGVTIDHGADAIKVIWIDWIGTCPIV